MSVILLALVGTAQAQAQPFDATAEADYASAIAYWGKEPNCTRALVERIDTPFEVEPIYGAWRGDPCGMEVKIGLSSCEEKGGIFYLVGYLLGLEDSVTEPVGHSFCEIEEERRLAKEEVELWQMTKREFRHVQRHCRHHPSDRCRRRLKSIRAELG